MFRDVITMTFPAGGFITGVKVAILKLFALKPQLHWPALLWLLTSCVADLLITATLVRSLVCHFIAIQWYINLISVHTQSQRKTGFVVTDTVVDKLIRCTSSG